MKLTATQQRALAYMRGHHGRLSSGEGFSVTTVRALERAGMCTVTTRTAADRILGGTRTRVFEAELTDAGWGDHDRTSHDPLVEPTLESELRAGDIVENVFSRSRAVWVGPSPLGGYTAQMSGAPIHTHEGCWRFISRPDPEAARAESVAPEVTPPRAKAPESVLGRDGHPYSPGQRVSFRTRDGFLISGEIESVHPGDNTVTFLADTRQVAPPARVPKGQTARPGRARAITPPEAWTVEANSRQLTRAH